MSGQRIKITDVLFDKSYSNFLKYCEEYSIIFVNELQKLDFIAYQREYSVKIEHVKEIEKYLVDILKGEILISNNLSRGVKEDQINSRELESITRMKKQYTLSNPYYLIPIEELNLSVRSYNCLTKVNITNVGQLLQWSDEELRTIRNLGNTSFNEVKEKINQVSNIFNTESLMKFHEPQADTNKEVFNECVDIPIEELHLSIRPYNCLVRSGITMTSQLVCMSKDQLYGIQHMGRKSVEEIIDKVKIITEERNTFNHSQENVERVKSDIEKNFLYMDVLKMRCKLSPLIDAYSSDEVVKNMLKQITDNIKIVSEMNTIIENQDYKSAMTLLPFSEWLKTDINEELNAFFFSQKKYLQAISCRANGGTLEAAGQLLGVTRERIRQIELRFQGMFNQFDSKHRILFIVSASCEGKNIIFEQDIKNSIRCEFIEQIIYLLKKSNTNNKYYTYSKDMDCFILGEKKEYDEEIDTFIEGIPEFISEEEMEIKTEVFSESNEIDANLIKCKAEKAFRKYGRYYSKRKLTHTDMYNYALFKHFPHGFKIDDDISINRIRNFIIDSFGEVQLPQNNRAIDARIMEIGVLCDRGTYTHNSGMEKFAPIINKIDAYIKSAERNLLTFHELFEIFNDELIVNYSIDNRYHMQGVIKYYLKEKYYFSRDAIAKNEDGSLLSELIKLVQTRKEITKAQMRSEFKGVTEAMLFQTLARCKDIIIIENGEYIHSDSLDIIEEDYEIEKYLIHVVNEMPISARKLLEQFYIKYLSFLTRNNISSHTKLFSVLRYMFYGKFNFSRPFIGKVDCEVISNLEVLKVYINERSVIEISEIISYCNENHINFISVTDMINGIGDKFIRSDANEMRNLENLEIDDYKLKQIKSILINGISYTGYLSVRKIEDFIFYPDVNIKWTGFLLKAIIEQYIDDIAIIEAQTSDIFYLNGIFINPDLNIETYEDFLRWAINTEHSRSSFKSIDEIKSWLIDEGLINQVIPKSMFDRGYLFIDEYGKVIVQ